MPHIMRKPFRKPMKKLQTISTSALCERAQSQLSRNWSVRSTSSMSFDEMTFITLGIIG